MSIAVVVDDSKAMRMIVSRSVRELGYEVQEAGDGQEALKIIQNNKKNVKLVLTDWSMPECDGLTLLRQLRGDPDLSALVVIMVTTETELSQVAVALNAGANEYVMKPFTKEILLEKVQLAAIPR